MKRLGVSWIDQTITGFGNLGLPAQYGHVFVVDVASGRAARIDSASGCRALGS